MQNRTPRWLLTGFLVAVVAIAGAKAFAQAPAPVNVVLKAFPITVAAGDYELVNQVLDFPPGSGVPLHVHGGPVVVTIVSGELVTVDNAGQRTLKAGDSLTEASGDRHSVVNRTSAITRVVASYLIPKGAARTTLVQ